MTHWAPDRKAEAIGLAMTVGAEEAAKRTGIPRRTISSRRTSPVAVAIVEETHADMVDTLKRAASAGAAALLAILSDPRAPARDKVRAAEVALEQHNLLSGGVTARTESANLNLNLTEEERLTVDGLIRRVEALPPDRQDALQDAIDRAISGRAPTAEEAAARFLERLKAERPDLYAIAEEEAADGQ